MPPPFDTLADLLPVAVYTCDAKGFITYYNPRAVELWGRVPVVGEGSPDRFSAATRLFLIDGSPLPHDQTPMAQALRSGASVRNAEVVMERPDGSRIVASVNVDPLYDDAGRITGAVNAFQDVTERVTANQSLVDSERRYRELIEAIGVAVYTTDPEGRITLYNEAAVELWGRRPMSDDRFCGSWKLFTVEGEPIRHEDCPMGVALREDRAVRGIEAMAERPDGTRVAFLPFPTPIYDSSGKLIGAVNVLIDITDRRRVEEAARESQAHLEAIFRSAITGMVEIEPDGTYKMVNDRYCELVGRTREELLAGMTKIEVTYPDDRDATRQQLRALSEGEDFFALEKRYLRPDGSIVWVHNGVSALRDASGRLSGAIAIVTDITDLVHATEELEEANNKKDEFLGLISHELRTPITTILGNAKILAERGQGLTPEQARQALNDVKNEAARLNRIIENLLAVARLERGQVVDTEPLLIGRVIKRVVDEHRLGSNLRAYSLDSDVEGVVVELNEVHLEQILKNLLSNAEKYAPPGTPVRVWARAEGDEIIVSVEDSGEGVDDAELEAVFDPFFRSARTANRAGIGIGLAVCRRLVTVMGGRIWAERAANGGARFSFSVPRSAP
jgi:PAS domain S-box-containing protein